MPHEHNIIDHDKHFMIDPITRKITPETPEKNKISQFDHKSERYTFEIPRYVEGHDMSLCDIVQFHYINLSADKSMRNSDVDESNDIGLLSSDEQKVIFSWLVTRNATKLSGTLNFAIRLGCRNGEKVDYEWHTEIYTGITVSSSLNNGEIIIQEYSDILEEWRQKLFDKLESIVSISLLAENWIPSSDKSYYTQDVTISGVMPTSKIDLQPTSEQMMMLINRGIIMFVSNDNGNVMVYSMKEKPSEKMTIQAIMKETKL